MADPYHHSLSSVKKYGGSVGDYMNVHEWFDLTKHHHGDFRHRALRHHTLGISECIAALGKTITNSDGRELPTRWIAEQHVIEDMGYIPSVTDWLKCIEPKPFMNTPRKLSREVG